MVEFKFPRFWICTALLCHLLCKHLLHLYITYHSVLNNAGKFQTGIKCLHAMTGDTGFKHTLCLLFATFSMCVTSSLKTIRHPSHCSSFSSLPVQSWRGNHMGPSLYPGSSYSGTGYLFVGYLPVCSSRVMTPAALENMLSPGDKQVFSTEDGVFFSHSLPASPPAMFLSDWRILTKCPSPKL